MVSSLVSAVESCLYGKLQFSLDLFLAFDKKYILLYDT